MAPRTPTGPRHWGGRTIAAAIAVLALFLTACAAPAPVTSPAPPPGPVADRVASTVTGAGATVHMEALQRIADGAGGNRASGRPGYEQSVDYVAGVLADAGFDVATPLYDTGNGRELRNVVARTRGGDQGGVVLAGAHLDSVREGPGINDNASGVAALLEIALRLGAEPGTRNTVAFGFWGSEEDDLQGSRSYVDGLSEAEQDAHLLYLNADMLGSRNGGYFVQGGTGDDEEETGADGSGAVAQVLAEELAATGVQAETIGLYGDDDAPFTSAGIPATGAVTGDADTKTAAQADRWGGTAGEVYDSCYHEACDDLDNVDPEKLDRYTKAIAGTVARFADAGERPSGG